MSKVKGVKVIDVKSTAIYDFHLEKIKSIVQKYKFEKIMLPILASESTFIRTIGESEIVQKEMFKIQGRNKIVLRPEGTALLAEHLLNTSALRHKNPKRYRYHGPMFRYEQPQKGRYRQFYQLGMESFNISPLIQEQEVFSAAWEIINLMGLSESVELEINNLGESHERRRYKKDLVEFLKSCSLNAEQLKNLERNPLRCLDTKDDNFLKQLENAPKITEYVDQKKFSILLEYLRDIGLPFKVNPLLVRGLDYYSGTVFEWKVQSKDLGSQSTLCAGGRYDTIFENMGSAESTTAFGLAFGMERMMKVSQLKTPQFPKSIYLFAKEEEDLTDALKVLGKSSLSIFFEDRILSFNSHIKKARSYSEVLYLSKGKVWDMDGRERDL